MHSSGNAEGTEGSVRRVLKGGRREDEIRRKAGERKAGREKMPKKESSGGRESKSRRRQPSRKRKVARAQEIAIWGRRGISWLPIQIQSVSSAPPPREVPFHVHPRKVVGLAPPTSCDESTSRVSLHWAPLERLLQGRLERARLRNGGFCGPITRLCHHRTSLLPRHRFFGKLSMVNR